jgi:hypothetical protein
MRARCKSQRLNSKPRFFSRPVGTREIPAWNPAVAAPLAMKRRAISGYPSGIGTRNCLYPAPICHLLSATARGATTRNSPCHFMQ